MPLSIPRGITVWLAYATIFLNGPEVAVPRPVLEKRVPFCLTRMKRCCILRRAERTGNRCNKKTPVTRATDVQSNKKLRMGNFSPRSAGKHAKGIWSTQLLYSRINHLPRAQWLVEPLRDREGGADIPVCPSHCPFAGMQTEERLAPPL